MSVNLVIEPTEGELLRNLAGVLVEAASEAIAARGNFSFALSGGSTPKALYALLASPEWAGKFDWSHVLVYFGDERAVAPEDALSNYRMAREALLDAVPLPEGNVFRMRGEVEDLEVAAAEYEAAIRSGAGTLDFVLLGLGPDGHTASLFPNSPQLEETSAYVVATPVASLTPHVRRLTLTYRAISEARQAVFLVTGVGKAPMVKEIISGERDAKRLPAQAVSNENLSWFLDQPAAAQVS